MAVPTPNQYWIRPDALTFSLNTPDVDYLRVSVLAGSAIIAYMEGVIDYDPSHNHRKWPIQAADTFLETTEPYYVHAQLTRSESTPTALIVYSLTKRSITGKIIEEDGTETGEEDQDYFYVYLGKISSSIDKNGQKVGRTWIEAYNPGKLDTNQGRAEDMDGHYLSKLFDDTAHGLINFEKGVRIDNILLKADADVLLLTNIETGKTASFAASGAVSAKGIGQSGGGGSVSYDRLDTWNSYTSDKAGYVLSAKLGWDLKTRLDNLDLGDFDLSGYYTAIEVNQLLSGKQDVISDLGTIRSGAALGATALQEHQVIYGLIVKGSNDTSLLSYTPNSKAAELTLAKSHVGLGDVDNLAAKDYFTKLDSHATEGAIIVEIGGTKKTIAASALKDSLSLNLVENTKLSTWAGTNEITTLGTITTGTWNGTKIANAYLANSKITIAGNDVSLGGSVTAATLQDSLDIVTLSGSQTISGAKTFGALITANGGVTVPSTKTIKIGGGTISWDSTNNAFKFSHSVYSLGAMSAKGVGTSSGAGGGVDVDWLNFPSSIVPLSGYDLGSDSQPWGTLYAETIYNPDNDLSLNSSGYIRMLTDVVFGNNDNFSISPTGTAYLGNIYSNGNIVATLGEVDAMVTPLSQTLSGVQGDIAMLKKSNTNLGNEIAGIRSGLSQSYYTKTEVDDTYLKQSAFNNSVAGKITSTNVTNWNTAYGWGNHAGEGYAKAVDVVDLSSQQTITGIKYFDAVYFNSIPFVDAGSVSVKLATMNDVPSITPLSDSGIEIARIDIGTQKVFLYAPTAANVDLSNYYTKTDIDDKGYATQQWVNTQLDSYALESSLGTAASKNWTGSNPNDTSSLVTVEWVKAKNFQPLITSNNKIAYSNISGTPTSLPASDVYAWAKASSKPSYSWSEITNKPTLGAAASYGIGSVASGNTGLVTGGSVYTAIKNVSDIVTTINDNYASVDYVDSEIETLEGDLAAFITATEVDTKLQSYATKATTLAGYGITDAFARVGRNNSETKFDFNTYTDFACKEIRGTEVAYTNSPQGHPAQFGLLVNLRDYNNHAKIQLYGADATGLKFRASQSAASTISTEWRTILDSSNYSSYALPLTGGEIKGSLGVTVNITAQGGTFAKGLKVGGNDVIHSGNIGSQSVARAKILVDENGSYMVYKSSAGNLMVGDNIYPSGDTHILGKKIWFRYGTDASYGLVLNSSGNVTIGSSDLAGTDYKLYVGGMAILKVNDANPAALYAENTNGKISLQTYTNRGVYDNTNSVWLIGTNGLDTFLMDGNVGIGTQSPTAKLHVNGNSYVNGTLNVSNVIEANKGINIYGALTGYVSGTDSDTWSITDQGAASFESVKIGSSPTIYKADNNALVVAKSGVTYKTNTKGNTLQVISQGAVGVDWSTAIIAYGGEAYNVVGSGVGLSLGGYVKGGYANAPIGRGVGIAAVAESSWYNSTGLAFYVNHNESSTSDDFTEKMRLSRHGHLIPMHNTSQTLGTSDKRWNNVYSSYLNISGAASVGSLTINGATAATQTWVQNQGYATQTSVNNSLGSLSAEISAVDARIDALGTAAKKNWSGASSADTTNLVTIGWVESKLAGYATAASIPTKTSQLTNDSNFLSGHIETTVIGGGTGLVTGGAVYSFVENSLSGYAKKATTLSGYGITDALPKSNPSVAGTLTVAGNVLPSNNNDTYALGSTNYRWSKLYINGVDCTGSISSTTNISAQGNVTAINGGLSGKTLSVSGAASVGSLTVNGVEITGNGGFNGGTVSGETIFGSVGSNYMDTYQVYIGGVYGGGLGVEGLIDAWGGVAGNGWEIMDTGDAYFQSVDQASDATLKSILKDVRLSLGTMANAPLVQFDWNNRNDGKHHVGTIAQYWDSCLPEVVSRTKGGTLALGYGELGVAMGISLAKEMIEMLTRVDNTESEVDKLKKKISELEKEIETLRAA